MIALLASCDSGKIANSKFYSIIFQQLSCDSHSNLLMYFSHIFSCREKLEHLPVGHVWKFDLERHKNT